MIRAGLLTVLFLGFLGACLFLPAGGIRWPAGWVCLLLFAGFTAAAFVVVPGELIRERAAPGPGSDRGDALLASLGFLGLYPGTLIVAGLDAGRSGSSLPLAVEVSAFVAFALGYGLALAAMRENRFFSTFVRIQQDRGHAVVSSGPYAWVRHPGYAGTLLAHLALPLALGSIAALVPALCGGLLFVLRTAREDRLLAERLPGYREYRTRVPRRLLPGVW
ncbi:MAG: isoprenylcysteine carboxylmethyltransferase family protein [Myxococcota bacterium]